MSNSRIRLEQPKVGNRFSIRCIHQSYVVRVLTLWMVCVLGLSLHTSVAAESEAMRIISLAPHLTEILFEIGAGEQIVGTVSYSNYPQAASEIPRIGGYNRLDLEAILEKRPDLILGWKSGNDAAELEQLRQLGLEVLVTESQRLEAVAQVMEQLGQRIGVEARANRQAAVYRQKLEQLRKANHGRRGVRVFYQLWNRPLITVNGEQIISDVIELCGGTNVFARLPALSPHISVEAVLEQDAEVFIASGMDVERPEWLDDWRQYPTLQAVKQENLYFIPPDILQRHGPRLVEGAEQLCQVLQWAREKAQ